MLLRTQRNPVYLAMAAVDVRKMQWYGKWRASVFKTIDQCFDFDASSVELSMTACFGVRGAAR